MCVKSVNLNLRIFFLQIHKEILLSCISVFYMVAKHMISGQVPVDFGITSGVKFVVSINELALETHCLIKSSVC